MARRKKKKQSRALVVFVVLVLIAAIVCGNFLWKGGYLDEYLHKDEDHTPPEDIITAELSIHFPMLGNANTGDCTLIKVGNTEVLIDAGSKRNSADAVTAYLAQYCTDGVLEYVIATHAHEDHIAAFVGSGSDQTDGVFEKFDCETVIDFPRTDKKTGIYQDYVELRDKQVDGGATHYTALECYKEENGAKRSYTLGENITLNILYQEFYEKKAGTENDYSVCVLLSQGNNHYLFTGDLEAEGEESLVENNTLPKCKLFKAGHHGSTTSSSSKLLEVIQPEIVCVCCCCGNNKTEYTNTADENIFPSQAFIDRVAPYTDKIYVTTIYDAAAEEKFAPMNGNIVVTSTGGQVNVTGSNHNTILKETAWFKENRTWNAQP